MNDIQGGQKDATSGWPNQNNEENSTAPRAAREQKERGNIGDGKAKTKKENLKEKKKKKSCAG